MIDDSRTIRSEVLQEIYMFGKTGSRAKYVM